MGCLSSAPDGDDSNANKADNKNNAKANNNNNSTNNNKDDSKQNDSKKAKEVQKKKEMKKVPKIDVMSLYKFGRTLGSGASCRVVSGQSKKDPEQQVAIKIMDKERSVTTKLYKREVSILQRLTPNMDTPHKSILQFLGYGEDSDCYYIITKLLYGGELFDRIVSKDDKYKMTERICVALICDMLKSVKFCHDHQVVHRDLKPENFVFASTRVDSDVVLIDYGCARIVTDEDIIDDVVGTAYYLAPELAIAALENYGKKGAKINSRIPKSQARTGKVLKAADVWSMGVIAYVMMTGRAPFRGRNNIAIFESTVLKPLMFPEKDARYHNKLDLSDHFKEFCRLTLNKDPAKRLSIEEAIRHPWVQGIGAKDHRLNSDVVFYLRQFAYQSKLKKEITRVLAANMTEEPQQQVLRHFKRLDADGDGFLDQSELEFLLLDMGYAKHNAAAEAVKIIHHADKNKDGVVDFEEFKQVWYRKVLTTNDAYIHRVFDVFDDNGDGHIDAEELGQILFPEKFDEKDGDADEQAADNNDNDDADAKPDEEVANVNDANDDDDNKEEMDQEDANFLENIKRMISEVDDNGDQQIDFDEFKKAMKEDLETGGFSALAKSGGGLIGPKIPEDD